MSKKPNENAEASPLKTHRHAPQGPKIQRDHKDALNHKDAFVSCTATAKGSRQRCKRRPIPGGTVCVKHGGGAPQVQAKAMDRLLALQHPAIDRLTKLIGQEAFPTVAYAASRDVLDRTMGKPAEQQTVEHTGTIRMIHELGE